MKTSFHKLNEGDKFHAGKSDKYIIYKKDGKNHGRCCEVVNLPSRHIGGMFRFGAHTQVWKIE
jgi:hypothetical protein